MSASTVLAACLMLASQTYSVPPAVLVGIYKAEGGQVGQEVANENGSYDLGPMQINTIWLPELSKQWGVNESTARRWIRDDACTNVGVAAWILRGHIDETKSLSQAIAHYHSRTPRYGTKYKSRVIGILKESGLVQNGH
ncbi:MAG: lytic transglycosylase domain-containing protein [Alphaproteobacteria bacterium]|nr:lytic transglycosylase domain-containing protein [Alphaproteobacteria bacterium]